MVYHVSIFKEKTKINESKFRGENFFEHENNLEAFSKQQLQFKKKRLLKYEYEYQMENEYGYTYEHHMYGEALLTTSGLYFSTSAIFEVGLIASEFTDTDEFRKYDPQTSSWE